MRFRACLIDNEERINDGERRQAIAEIKNQSELETVHGVDQPAAFRQNRLEVFWIFGFMWRGGVGRYFESLFANF